MAPTFANGDQVEAWKATTRASEVQSAWVDKQEAKGVKEVGVVLQKVQAIMNDAVR